jgi:hypothetical protein
VHVDSRTSLKELHVTVILQKMLNIPNNRGEKYNEVIKEKNSLK